MRRACFVAMVCTAVLVASAEQVQSALIDSGAVTSDTATGLEWLDVTQSQGLSYDSVSSQFGIGDAFESFRYATRAEVDQLFRNAGFGATDGIFRTADFTVAQDFMNLVGVTSASARGDAVLGITGDLIGSNSRQVFTVAFEVPPFQNPSAGYAIGLDSAGSSLVLSNQDASFRGSWLVRQTAANIPEPTTLAIWSVLGGIGLAVGHRRRRRKAA